MSGRRLSDIVVKGRNNFDLFRWITDSDKAGRVFRFQAGQHSNMKLATAWRPVGRVHSSVERCSGSSRLVGSSGSQREMR